MYLPKSVYTVHKVRHTRVFSVNTGNNRETSVSTFARSPIDKTECGHAFSFFSTAWRMAGVPACTSVAIRAKLFETFGGGWIQFPTRSSPTTQRKLFGRPASCRDHGSPESCRDHCIWDDNHFKDQDCSCPRLHRQENRPGKRTMMYSPRPQKKYSSYPLLSFTPAAPIARYTICPYSKKSIFGNTGAEKLKQPENVPSGYTCIT